jgi:hypothetical protein
VTARPAVFFRSPGQVTDENSAKDRSHDESSISAFLEGLYGDPLTAETMRTARYLVVASAICTAVVLFKVRLQSTSLIPLDFGDRIDVLPMLLSLAVLVLLVSFCLRAATDLLRDRETGILVTRYIEVERTAAALASAREVDSDMADQQREDYEGYSEPEPWWERYGEVSEAADAAVKRAEERIGIRRLPRMLRRVRSVLEIGVPSVFAVVALVLSRASLGSFFGALLSAFQP